MQKTIAVSVNYDFLVDRINKNMAFIKRAKKRQAKNGMMSAEDEQHVIEAINNLNRSVETIRAGLRENNETSLKVNGEDWYGFIAEGGYELMLQYNGLQHA